MRLHLAEVKQAAEVPAPAARPNPAHTSVVQTFEIEPRGPFSLEAARTFAGGFAAGIGGGNTTGVRITMAFPLEGWQESVAVDVRQLPSGIVEVRFDGSDDLDAIRRQVARCLSLDHDGTGWPAVGERDPVIGRLQADHAHLRPVCFYSAYEAATSFVIGHRIARRQSARIKAWLGEELGDHVSLEGATHSAFPRPQRLLGLVSAPGLNPRKSSGCTAWPRLLSTDGLTPSGSAPCRPTTHWRSS